MSGKSCQVTSLATKQASQQPDSLLRSFWILYFISRLTWLQQNACVEPLPLCWWRVTRHNNKAAISLIVIVIWLILDASKLQNNTRNLIEETICWIQRHFVEIWIKLAVVHWQVTVPLQTINLYTLSLIISSAVTVFVQWLHEGHDLKSLSLCIKTVNSTGLHWPLFTGTELNWGSFCGAATANVFSCSSWFVLITGGRYDCVRRGQVIVWDPAFGTCYCCFPQRC